MGQNSWKRTFSIIWVGQFLSLVSSSAVNFAIIIWMSLEYGSAEVLAFSAIAALLPQALIGPFAGVYIDRWDRKKVMIFADAFIAFCTFLMAINFYLGNESLIFIYILLGLRSIGAAFHMPAMQASVPLLAPEDQLLRIAGINQMIQSISSVAGPALGALAIGLFPIGYVLWLDIIGALLAIGSLLLVHIPNPVYDQLQKASVQQAFADIKLGLKDITKNPGLSWLFTYSVILTFCIMPVAIMFPLLTLNHFGGGKWEMSLIEVIWGVGMLVGGGLLGLFKSAIRKIILINIASILLGATLALSGFISGDLFYLFVFLTALGGLSAAIYNAAFTTILQEEISADKLGRVFSMYYSIAIIPSVIGLVFTGAVADWIGINLTFIILGSMISVIGLVSFFTSALMKLGNKN